MVEPTFTPEAVKNLQPYIQKTVDDLLEQMKQKGCANGPVDLVKEFALPVPSYVSHGGPFLKGHASYRSRSSIHFSAFLSMISSILRIRTPFAQMVAPLPEKRLPPTSGST